MVGKEIGEEMSMGCFDKLSTTPIPRLLRQAQHGASQMGRGLGA